MDSICPTICVGSIGDVGSCVFNCAIKSCRNKSLELLASASVDELLLLVRTALRGLRLLAEMLPED